MNVILKSLFFFFSLPLLATDTSQINSLQEFRELLLEIRKFHLPTSMEENFSFNHWAELEKSFSEDGLSTEERLKLFQENSFLFFLFSSKDEGNSKNQASRNFDYLTSRFLFDSPSILKAFEEELFLFKKLINESPKEETENLQRGFYDLVESNKMFDFFSEHMREYFNTFFRHGQLLDSKIEPLMLSLIGLRSILSFDQRYGELFLKIPSWWILFEKLITLKDFMEVDFSHKAVELRNKTVKLRKEIDKLFAALWENPAIAKEAIAHSSEFHIEHFRKKLIELKTALEKYPTPRLSSWEVYCCCLSGVSGVLESLQKVKFTDEIRSSLVKELIIKSIELSYFYEELLYEHKVKVPQLSYLISTLLKFLKDQLSAYDKEHYSLRDIDYSLSQAEEEVEALCKRIPLFREFKTKFGMQSGWRIFLWIEDEFISKSIP